MEQNEQGNVSPWLLVTLIVVILAAVGVFGWYSWNKSKTPAVAPAVTPTQTVSTADWKTYTNTKYGYLFKYPSNWFVGGSILDREDVDYSTSDNVCINKEKGCLDAIGFSVIVKDNPSNLDLDAFVTKIEKNSNGDIYKHESLKLAGGDGLKSTLSSECSGVGCDLLRFYIGRDNKIININYEPGQSVSTYNTILSTFKFTSSSVSTADWKTYSDKTNGFSFKYPGDWSGPDSSSTALNAQLTLLFLKGGNDNILTVSRFTGIGKVYGVNGATSVTDLVNKTPNIDLKTIQTLTIGKNKVTIAQIIPGEGVFAGNTIYMQINKAVYVLVFSENSSNYSTSLRDSIIESFQEN